MSSNRDARAALHRFGAENRRGPWGFSKGTGSETRGKALAAGLES